MEQSYTRDYPSSYAAGTVSEEEQTPTLPNNVAAMVLFAALGVVAAVLAFITARARRKPKTARERFMELVEEGRVLGAKIAEQIAGRVGTGMRDGLERLRNRWK